MCLSHYSYITLHHHSCIYKILKNSSSQPLLLGCFCINDDDGVEESKRKFKNEEFIGDENKSNYQRKTHINGGYLGLGDIDCKYSCRR